MILLCAMAKTPRSGNAEANRMWIRRQLIVTPAAIFSNFKRIVPAVAIAVKVIHSTF